MAVGLVDGAAGEHVGAADEVGVQVAAQHEDLDGRAVGAVADEHDRGRVANGRESAVRARRPAVDRYRRVGEPADAGSNRREEQQDRRGSR